MSQSFRTRRRNLGDSRVAVTTSRLTSNEAGGRISVEPRPAALVATVGSIDASLQHEGLDLKAISDAIADHFAKQFSRIPMGVVARCYLGPPYVVHYLDLLGFIVDHFAPAESMPDPFERARTLALHPAYEFVEVYSTELVCVGKHGEDIQIPSDAGVPR